MTIAQIYSGTPNNGIANTDLFIDGSAIFMVAPDLTDEVELDFYLQVEIDTENRLLKLNPEYRLDTVVLFPVPDELRNCNLNMYGVILTTFPVAIEVYVIFKNTDTEELLQQIYEEILALRQEFALEQARNIATDIAFALAGQQLSIGLGILATGLIPITGGVSSTAVPAFGGSTSILAPVTIGGLLG
ncbi:hypothetical protein AA637_11870 [Cyanobacterium sp. HL-69]|uniref:hypothetical protein n=1 Tax=Cyanobacterium sp. HL-69 TaxID=2054282 RepID=UPI000CA0C60E|nr:hypothetical protein AA637_11870 [Cyanobacterium sp. HL-69]